MIKLAIALVFAPFFAHAADSVMCSFYFDKIPAESYVTMEAVGQSGAVVFVDRQPVFNGPTSQLQAFLDKNTANGQVVIFDLKSATSTDYKISISTVNAGSGETVFTPAVATGPSLPLEDSLAIAPDQNLKVGCYAPLNQ